MPQTSRREFRYGAVESLHGSSDISRDRCLDKKYLFMGFHKDLFDALHFLCVERVVHTLLSSSRQVNTSRQVWHHRSIGFPTLQAHVPSSKAAQDLKRGKKKKKTTSLCVAIHLLLSYIWQWMPRVHGIQCYGATIHVLQNIWNVFKVVPLPFKH